MREPSKKRKRGKNKRCTTDLSAGRDCGEPGKENYSRNE
jgi:hypothetical protein